MEFSYKFLAQSPKLLLYYIFHYSLFITSGVVSSTIKVAPEMGDVTKWQRGICTAEYIFHFVWFFKAVIECCNRATVWNLYWTLDNITIIQVFCPAFFQKSWRGFGASSPNILHEATRGVRKTLTNQTAWGGRTWRQWFSPKKRK